MSQQPGLGAAGTAGCRAEAGSAPTAGQDATPLPPPAAHPWEKVQTQPWDGTEPFPMAFIYKDTAFYFYFFFSVGKKYLRSTSLFSQSVFFIIIIIFFQYFLLQSTKFTAKAWI